MRIIRDRSRTVELEEFLARPLFAHLATASEHGPRDSPVWFLWDGSAAWIIGDRKDTFPGRVEREPRCALGIVDFDVASGLVHHVGMRGCATVEAWDPERAQGILSKYLGPNVDAWDERFQSTLRDPTDQVLVRFEPETVVARDQSYKVHYKPASHADRRVTPADYPSPVRRSLGEKIRNPFDWTCNCDPSCWCRRSRLGHALMWYVPPRFHRFPPDKGACDRC